MPRPRCCVGRAASPSHIAVVHEISQRGTDAFIFGERCSGLARRRTSRAHSLSPSSRRATSQIWPDLIYDRHSIRDKPAAPASPWQNGFAERLIGSIRRECVDHIIVLGEAHLRRILRSYARYYNEIRTHRSLDKDAPVTRPVQRVGIISSRAVLGGLHHRYAHV